MKNSDFEKSRADAKVLWRFSDLKALGIVEDRATGRRWMDTEEFPTTDHPRVRIPSRGTPRKCASG